MDDYINALNDIDFQAAEKLYKLIMEMEEQELLKKKALPEGNQFYEQPEDHEESF